MAVTGSNAATVMIVLQAQKSLFPLGYWVSLLQAALGLIIVCVLAWLALRWVAKRTEHLNRSRRLRVLERTPLDSRKSLYLIEVGSKVMVVGYGQNGPPAVLTEMAKEELPEIPAPKTGAQMPQLSESRLFQALRKIRRSTSSH